MKISILKRLCINELLIKKTTRKQRYIFYCLFLLTCIISIIISYITTVNYCDSYNFNLYQRFIFYFVGLFVCPLVLGFLIRKGIQENELISIFNICMILIFVICTIINSTVVCDSFSSIGFYYISSTTEALLNKLISIVIIAVLVISELYTGFYLPLHLETAITNLEKEIIDNYGKNTSALTVVDKKNYSKKIAKLNNIKKNYSKAYYNLNEFKNNNPDFHFSKVKKNKNILVYFLLVALVTFCVIICTNRQITSRVSDHVPFSSLISDVKQAFNDNKSITVQSANTKTPYIEVYRNNYVCPYISSTIKDLPLNIDKFDCLKIITSEKSDPCIMKNGERLAPSKVEDGIMVYYVD